MTDINNENYLEQIIVPKVIKKCESILGESIFRESFNIYDEAWEIVCRARVRAKELGIAVVITVVDASAQVVMTYRMEDALLVSNDMAYKKAYTAVGMKMPSKDLATLTQPGQWLYQLETMTDNKVVSLSGGMPIFSSHRIAGGIGVSGGDPVQDQLIAEYALQNIMNNR